MATALSLIKSALKKIRVLGVDREPTASESADGLTALNAMLDAWAIERLMVYQVRQRSLSWPSATQSRTIGSGGNFSVDRPIRIDSAFLRDSNSQDYPLSILTDRTQYDGIVSKTQQSTLPEYLFYDPAYPLGTLYLYTVPTDAITLLLNVWQTLQSFTSLTADLALPPGYQRAIEFNLAPEIASDYGMEVPANVQRIAVQSKAAIKAINVPSMVAQIDRGLVGRGRRSDIYTDR